MLHYERRQMSGGSTAPNTFFNLGKKLAASRSRLRPEHKPVVVKPSLTSSKQKEEVLKESVEHYLPSGLRLAKLRQLAAQHKIMGERGRKFLQETTSGNKIQGKEELVKLDADMLEAENQAIELQAGHDPRTFEFRKEQDHPERLAKKLVKGLYHDAAQQAKDVAMKQSVADERRAHHAMVDSMLGRNQTAQAPAQPQSGSSHGSTTMQQAIIEPTPLHQAGGMRSGSMAPMVGGGHITQSSPTDGAQTTPISIGVPVAVSAEASTAANRADDIVHEPSPAVPSEPSVSIAPEPSVQLPDMSHLSDPFGGDD